MTRAVARLRFSFKSTSGAGWVMLASASVIHHLLAAQAQGAILFDVEQMPPAAAAFQIVGPRHFDPLAAARRDFRHDEDFGEFGKASRR